MSQGGFVTLVGFVAMEPSLRVTKDGHHVADVRVGTASRMLDKQTGEWVDGETSFYTVTCWRRLADHAKASLRKGDPVLVKGRFRTSSYEDKTGRLRTEVEIVADTVGHDLSRGIANYIRPERARQNAADDPAAGGPQSGAPIDEEAIERFGRELDESLPGAEFAAHALEPDDAAAPF
jgi:single-strand DNA-binding protein